VSAAPGPTLDRLEAFDVTAFGSHLTLLVPQPRGPALLASPALGEWLSLDVERADGGSISLTRAGFRMTLAPSTGAATLTLDGGPARPVKVVAKAIESPRTPVGPIPTFDGDAPQPTFPVRVGSVAIAWSDAYYPAFPSFASPAPVALGASSLVPESVTPRTIAGCVMRGTRPGAAGALGETLRTASESEASAVCAASGGRAVLEASYSVVRFAGVNRLDDTRAPGPTDVVAINWLHRATTPDGSTVTETGSLVGLASATVAPLRSLLAPTGLDWLQREARTTFATPAGLDRNALIDVTRSSLTVGPSTVDVVVPTSPLGIFLRSRHVALGPRSTVAPAFVRGPLTERMVAMVNVDY
jgi:hypothetical protein